MPRLILINLHCIETEDNSGADHVYITIDDAKVWGPVKINDGQTKNIGVNHDFVHRAIVRLYDYDSTSADDFLGSLTVTTSDADGREKEHYFTEDDANYRMNYKVLMNPNTKQILKAKSKEDSESSTR